MNFINIIIIENYLKLGAFERTKIRKLKNKKKGNTLTASVETRKRFTRRQLAELFFESCIDCKKMAAIPQGAFAVRKVRCNEELNVSALEIKEKIEKKKENIFNPRPPLKGWELTPLKYNSKLMNSIWGLYNRYSVHNFKKNTDAEKGARGGVVATIWGIFLENRPPIVNAAATATAEAPPIMKTKNRL